MIHYWELKQMPVFPQNTFYQNIYHIISFTPVAVINYFSFKISEINGYIQKQISSIINPKIFFPTPSLYYLQVIPFPNQIYSNLLSLIHLLSLLFLNESKTWLRRAIHVHEKNIIHSKVLSNMIRNLVYYIFTNSVIPESDQHTAGGTSMYSVC